MKDQLEIELRVKGISVLFSVFILNLHMTAINSIRGCHIGFARHLTLEFIHGLKVRCVDYLLVLLPFLIKTINLQTFARSHTRTHPCLNFYHFFCACPPPYRGFAGIFPVSGVRCERLTRIRSCSNRGSTCVTKLS